MGAIDFSENCFCQYLVFEFVGKIFKFDSKIRFHKHNIFNKRNQIHTLFDHEFHEMRLINSLLSSFIKVLQR